MRSFRAQIVASTVLLVAAVMVAVVLGTQVVLELSEGNLRAQSSWNVLLATGLVGTCGVALSGFVAWRLSQRVARAIRAEQRLAAELAHEIRTPLTAIRGSAELALRRAPAESGLRTDLTEIAEGSRRLAEVVTSLLELSQDPGALQAATRPDAVITQVAGLVPAHVGLEVTGWAPPVAGPLALVTRALAPLVENAGQHAEKQVTVNLRSSEFIEIAVSDDGPGVEASLRASVFEPGVSTSGSSGLGLGIARRVARSLGGDVVLRGDEFVLRLPRA